MWTVTSLSLLSTKAKMNFLGENQIPPKSSDQINNDGTRDEPQAQPQLRANNQAMGAPYFKSMLLKPYANSQSNTQDMDIERMEEALEMETNELDETHIPLTLEDKKESICHGITRW